MFKRLLFLLVPLLLVVGLAACDDMDAASNEELANEETDKDMEKENKEKEKELAKQEKEEEKQAKKEEKEKEKEKKKLAKEKEKEEKAKIKEEEKLAKEKEKEEEKAAADKKKKDEEESAAKKKHDEDNRPIDKQMVEDNDNITRADLHDGGVLIVGLDGDGSFSVNTMVSNQAMTILETMKTAFDDKEVKTFIAVVEGTMMDAKGNESKNDVVSITYKRDSFEELNYDNFHSLALGEEWRIYNEADEYFIRIGVYDDLKDKIKDNLEYGNYKN